MNLAPVVLFAFNRLDVLQETVTSLLKNPESKNSDLFVFVDGPRKNRIDEDKKVESVQNFVKGISGFKSLTYTFAEQNKGLAPSIIEGVSKIFEKYDKVIVVEDDLLLSPSFLKYMNIMLDRYSNINQVMQVSGFGVKIKVPDYYKYDSYFNIRAQCWSWGTWKDRWNTIDWDVEDWDKLSKDKALQRNFNKAGSDMYGMLKNFMEGKISSWYIRFCYSMFKQNRYCICPIRSLVINEGFRPDSTHCNQYNRYKVDYNETYQEQFTSPKIPTINDEIQKKVLQYWSIKYRIYGKLLKFLMYIGLLKNQG